LCYQNTSIFLQNNFLWVFFCDIDAGDLTINDEENLQKKMGHRARLQGASLALWIWSPNLELSNSNQVTQPQTI